MKMKLRLIFVLFCLFLSGCSTYHKALRDGPPDFYVDVSKIPDAVPKVEPSCRFGNPPTYVVRGHRYYVMRNAKGYDERGIASWYGTLFHKHRTSCGEPYDMLAMTAASRTLPLPSYAMVTNLQNNRRVIVKVNDRGPFEHNRLMDLSWVAAKKLGITGRGTGYVEVKVIDPLTWKKDADVYIKAPEPKLEKPGRPILYLQVGAFSTESKAKQIAKQVQDLTHRSVRIKAKDDKHPIYRVQVGPLVSVVESDRVNHLLRSAGFVHPVPVIQ